MKGNYVCLVLSLDLRRLIERWAQEECTGQVREGRWEGGSDGGREGKRKGGKAQGTSSARRSQLCIWHLKGPLLLPAVLAWITDCDLKLLGCTPAPRSLLQPSLPQQDTKSFDKFYFLSVFSPWCLTIQHVTGFLDVSLLSPLTPHSTPSRSLTRPWTHMAEQNTV